MKSVEWKVRLERAVSGHSARFPLRSRPATSRSALRSRSIVSCHARSLRFAPLHPIFGPLRSHALLIDGAVYCHPPSEFASSFTRLGFKTCLSKTKTKTKTCLSKTKTETQDLQVKYWKSVTGIDCDKQKDWKSHGKQYTVNNKYHTMFDNSSISAVTVNNCSVYFGTYTKHFESTTFDRQLKH